jgi:hypothetical protein
MGKRNTALAYKNGIKNIGDGSPTLVSVLLGATSPKDVSMQLKKVEAVNLLNPSEGQILYQT